MSESIRTVSAAEFQRLLNANSSLKVIDVRTPLEYSEVHVKEAKLVPLDELDPAKLDLDKDQPLYVLCRSGARATKAAERLAQAGFQQAVVVEGGTLACIDAGLPVVRSGKKVMSLERQVRIAAGSLVLLGVVLSLSVHPAFIYLSGFIGAGLVFAGITDWCGMGLLIAKAPWNRR
jgi:rhodanese-related sulfurtransferase